MCNENRQFPLALAIARAGRVFVPVIASMILAQMGLARAQKVVTPVPVPASTVIEEPEVFQDPEVPATPPPSPTPTPPPSPVTTPAPPLPPLPETIDRPRIIIPRPPAPAGGPPGAAAGVAAVPPIPGEPAGAMRFINLRRDSTGLLPELPPGPAATRDTEVVMKHVDNLLERVIDPEAEINLVVGQTKVLETRKPLRRIAVANPAHRRHRAPERSAQYEVDEPLRQVFRHDEHYVLGGGRGSRSREAPGDVHRPRRSRHSRPGEADQSGFSRSGGQGPAGRPAGHPRRAGA